MVLFITLGVLFFFCIVLDKMPKESRYLFIRLIDQIPHFEGEKKNIMKIAFLAGLMIFIIGLVKLITRE